MWAAGNKPSTRPAQRSSGLTLLEMLVVVALIAMGTLGVALALRDNHQLDREAQRLVALLETARAQSQASGVPVLLRVSDKGFEFEGLPSNPAPYAPPGPNTATPGSPAVHPWLYPDTQAQILRLSEASPPNALLLGPEPLVPAQALRLRRGSSPDTRALRTDGLRGFEVLTGGGP